MAWQSKADLRDEIARIEAALTDEHNRRVYAENQVEQQAARNEQLLTQLGGAQERAQFFEDRCEEMNAPLDQSTTLAGARGPEAVRQLVADHGELEARIEAVLAYLADRHGKIPSTQHISDLLRGAARVPNDISEIEGLEDTG